MSITLFLNISQHILISCCSSNVKIYTAALFISFWNEIIIYSDLFMTIFIQSIYPV